MTNRVTGGFIKVSEWINKIAPTLIVTIFVAGFSDHMDIAANKQDIVMLKKTVDRLEAQIAQVQTDQRVTDTRTDELARKSISKMDEIILLMKRKKQ